MINKAILTGRLTRDIELKRTNDGTSYTFFTLAVNNRRSGNDQTDFVPCIAWRQTADLMNNYLKKGSLIGVEGRINVYTKQSNGQYDTNVNVQVENLTFLESKSQSSDRTQNKSFGNDNNEQMTFSSEPSFSQKEVTPPSVNNESFDEPEKINANNINLEEIKF